MTLTALFQSMATLVLLLLGMAAIGDWIRRGNQQQRQQPPRSEE